MFIGTTKTYQGQISHKVYFNMDEGAIGAIVFSRVYDFTSVKYGDEFTICTVYLKGETVSEDAGLEIDIDMGKGILMGQGYKEVEPAPNMQLALGGQS